MTFKNWSFFVSIFLHMLLLNSIQTAYVISAIICGLLIIALVAFLIFKNVYSPKHIRELTYFKLNSLCNTNDYLLLNNYRIHIDDSNIGSIDHIVISNKYIIIINDFSLSGVISGSAVSEKLKAYDKKGANLIVNPLNYNINLSKRLALFNDLSNGLIKGLVVIHNDSKINLTNTSNQFKMIKLKDLKKTIKAFDKEPVKNLKEDDVVRFINYLNSNNK